MKLSSAPSARVARLVRPTVTTSTDSNGMSGPTSISNDEAPLLEAHERDVVFLREAEGVPRVSKFKQERLATSSGCVPKVNYASEPVADRSVRFNSEDEKVFFIA